MVRKNVTGTSTETLESAEDSVDLKDVEGKDEAFHDAENVDVEKVIAEARGEEVDEQESKKVHTEDFIKYVGRASNRIISSDEWPDGVEPITAEWGFFNNFKIPASAFDQGHLDYLTSDQDEGFELVTETVVG